MNSWLWIPALFIVLIYLFIGYNLYLGLGAINHSSKNPRWYHAVAWTVLLPAILVFSLVCGIIFRD